MVSPVRMAAITAVPMAPPTVRSTAFIPLAMPLCSTGTAPLMYAGIAEKARPMPRPKIAEAV